jgi:hypothetical protein
MSIASLLDKFIEPFAEAMSPESAARMVALRADPEVQRRLDELADECPSGELAVDEQEEYDSYLHAIGFISILQSKARQVLAPREPT